MLLPRASGLNGYQSTHCHQRSERLPLRWEWPEQPLGADHTASAHRRSLHNAGSMVSTRWSQLAGLFGPEWHPASRKRAGGRGS